MTRTVGDAALMLTVLAGYDRFDIASVVHPAEDYVAAMARRSRACVSASPAHRSSTTSTPTWPPPPRRR